MSQLEEDFTYNVPRFLSFINLAYLHEAAKAADAHLVAKLDDTSEHPRKDHVGNVNAARQSLLRAVFIASYATIERNLDELVVMERGKQDVSLHPRELRDRGVTRSLTYAIKILGKNIDRGATHWRDLLLLQELRNHLAHYGPHFADRKTHNELYTRLSGSKYVTLKPLVCFSLTQLEDIFELYTTCIQDFSQ